MSDPAPPPQHPKAAQPARVEDTPENVTAALREWAADAPRTSDANEALGHVRKGLLKFVKRFRRTWTGDEFRAFLAAIVEATRKPAGES